MQIFAKRPLAAACASAMIISVCTFFLTWLGKLLLATVLVLLISLCILRIRLRKSRTSESSASLLTAILCLVLMLLAVAQSAWHFDLADRVPQSVADREEECSVECLILEEGSAGGGYAYYTVRVTRVNGIRTDFRAALECSYTATFHVGDVVALTAQARSTDVYYDRENRLYAIADGIRLGLICEDPASASVVGNRAMPLRNLFTRWRENLTARLLRLTGKQNGGLVAALFLGDRGKLDPSISTGFRRSGVSHLLALSGMHVTLLLTMLTTLTTGLHIPKKGRMLLLSLLALCYLALTGFRLSAIRAVGMVLMLYLAEFVGTRSDPLTTLCVIGMTMLTASPATVADGGFWMSFCAVFGLVTLLPPLNDWLRKRRISRRICAVLQAIAASVVAVISVSMLSWLFCGELSPIGILVTVMLTPILTLILSLTPLTLLLDLIPMLSATPLALPLKVLLEWMVDLTDLVAHLPHVSVSLQVPFAGVILILMTLALLAMLIMPLRHKWTLCLPPILAVLSFAVCFTVWNHITYDEQVQASYVVRSSGSALVLTDREKTVIIDTSAGNYAMLRDAERAAHAMGATEIDSLVLTHYHRAFVYSTERLAKRQIVRRVFLPMPQNESEYFILTAIRDRLTPLGTEVLCYDGAESLKVLPSAVYSRVDTSCLKRSAQPIVTYLVQTEHEVLTFTSSAVQESDYAPMFRQLAAWSDILILGEDGPTIKMPLELPLTTATPRLLLTDSTKVLAYLDVSAASPLYAVKHITDITCYPFSILK